MIKIIKRFTILLFVIYLFSATFYLVYLVKYPCESLFWDKKISFFNTGSLKPWQCFSSLGFRRWTGVWIVGLRENEFYPDSGYPKISGINEYSIKIDTIDQAINLIRSAYYSRSNTHSGENIKLRVEFFGELYFNKDEKKYGTAVIYTTNFISIKPVE